MFQLIPKSFHTNEDDIMTPALTAVQMSAYFQAHETLFELDYVQLCKTQIEDMII